MLNLKTYLTSYDSKSTRTIEDVRNVLLDIDERLQNSELSRLRSFNTAYRLVTEKVLHAIEKDTFADQKFLEAFDIRFVSYYITALRSYVLGLPASDAWKTTFEAALPGQGSPLKVMALGVNAHVNNDIPQVLRDCSAKHHHFRDYQVVNGIIDQTLEEVMDMTIPGSVRSVGIEKPFRFCYKQTMRILIRAWRLQAWVLYRQLNRDNISAAFVERQASLVSRGAQTLLT